MHNVRNRRFTRSSAMRGILGMILVSLVGLSVLALSLGTLIPEETQSAWTADYMAGR